VTSSPRTNLSPARPANASHQNAPLTDFLKRTEVRRANARDESPRLNVRGYKSGNKNGIIGAAAVLYTLFRIQKDLDMVMGFNSLSLNYEWL